MNKRQIFAVSTCLLLLLGSCGTKKTVVQETIKPSVDTLAQSSEKQKLAYVKKVAANAVNVDNISSKITFNLQAGDKDITVPGKIQMRKDDVIRIQLMIPLLGSEVGRLEFTKDYVLVIDRINKEYVKGDYNQLDFLRENGLNFYSLQALFWNQLFMPGAEKLDNAKLEQFHVDFLGVGPTTPVSYQQGNLTYLWNTDSQTARIKNARMSYESSKHGNSVLTMTYDNFKSIGSKPFPLNQKIHFSTSATNKKKEGTISIEMGNVDTSGGWDARTNVSDKYKKVETNDVLGKIMSL